MAKIPVQRSEATFTDDKPAYTRAQAIVEANRCLYCHDAPCVRACPTHIDIPNFIRKIATGNVHGSAKTIFESNILGMSCARVCPVEVLCVGDCVDNLAGVPPIQIGKLQRYATDVAFANGWRFFERGADTGKRIALIGGGPASLACAHELSRHGHRCVIFEKRPVVGGLNATGVAPYKMRADRAEQEVEWILGIGGIEIQHEAVTDIAALVASFDAVFLGLGLGEDSKLGVPGEDLPGVEGAVHFIERMKLGTVDLTGVTHAAIIGGGNTAIDAARELKRLGVPCVRMVYRGDEAAMSGYRHEWEHAKIEGVIEHFRAQPLAFEGHGHVSHVRCVATKNRQPMPGTEHRIEAELVLLAIGQAKLGSLAAQLGGIALDKGRVLTDSGGRTGHPKVWAGGDCANGGKEVVNAAAEGKAAANSIHAALRGA
jgi:glutamate synthase (NADPH/NADH) small chain